MKSGSRPPPPPDYEAQAKAQADASRQNVYEQSWANRPTQVTPWGREEWSSEMTADPATGKQVPKWTQTTTIDPKLQEALNQQLGIQSERSQIAGGMLGRIGEEFDQPFDWSSLPQAPSGTAEAAQEQAYGRMQELGRPERQYEQQELTRSLANQGVTPGSPQYERAMRLAAENTGRQDLQNMLAAGGEGRAMGGYQQGLRSNAIAEQMQKRGMSLNELNALLTGQQVQMPGMPGFQSQGVAQTPDLLGASQGQYGGQLNSYNASQANKASNMQSAGQAVGMIAMVAF